MQQTEGQLPGNGGAALPACRAIFLTAPSTGYWARVLGRPTVSAARLRRLQELDAAQWSHLNPATMDMLETLSGQGARLALLSNMPVEMSKRYLRESPWAAYFEKLYFSGPLGMTKPDHRVFSHVQEDLAAAAEDVVFIDDNARNIEAAGELRWRTVRFGPNTDLRRELGVPGT